MNFGSGKAVQCGRTGAEKLAKQREDICRPGLVAIAARKARAPGSLAALDTSAKKVSVKHVKAAAAEA